MPGGTSTTCSFAWSSGFGGWRGIPSARARERYFCSYGIDPGFEKLLVDRGLPIVGRADDGTPRILELPDHPFFIATLFVPQSRSTPAAPHPLVTGFLRAAAHP